MLAPRRPNLRLLLALGVITGLFASAWLLLRDSSLVAVRKVEVTGLAGPQAEEIRSALTTAGRDMTTLHLRPDALMSAVRPYAVVKDVAVERDVPHGLRIRVTRRIPVARVVTSGAALPVAADGTLLRGTTADDVPELRLRVPPAGETITDQRALVTVALLARAPQPLRRRVTTAFPGPRGLTVRLAAGPSVYFGSSERMTAKWASLTAVLASPDSRGATAIDVRVPEHPAAAGLEQGSVQRGQPSTGT